MNETHFWMKKILFALLASLLLAINVTAQDQEGLFSLGGNISYGSEQDLIGFGARAQYGFTDHIRGVAEYKYYLDRRDWSEWQISMDAHYLIEASQTVSVYPIVGIRHSRWTVDTSRGSLPQGVDPYKKSTSKLGANLGFGTQIELSYHVFLQLEPKYEINKYYSQFSGSVGLMFQF